MVDVSFGIDLGGTKIEILAIDGTGKTVVRKRVSTPSTYEGVVAAIVRLVHDSEKDLAVRGTVGVGHPGAVDPSSGKLRNANLLCLNDRSFAKDLGERLQRCVRTANDANCFALSEARDGAAAGAGVVLGIILGTGVGGGLVVDGRLVPGAHGFACEWGHNPLPWPAPEEWPGPPCSCGRTGCIEAWIAGRAFRSRFRDATGLDRTVPEIVVSARSGEDEASTYLDRWLDRVSRSLASLLNVIDPDTVVFGGGLSNIDELYQELSERVAVYTIGPVAKTTFVRARHGDSSGVRGAAWLGREPVR